ncbi:MAG: fumarate hydratase C-terminal domain-containing protein [Candidatus Thermoplasmatota archaeon]
MKQTCTQQVEGGGGVSAGPTTSSHIDMFEDLFIEEFDFRLIIGKGDMGKNTQKALQKYIFVYSSYAGGG